MARWWLSGSGPRMLKAEARAATSKYFFKATLSGDRSASNSSDSFFNFIKALRERKGESESEERRGEERRGEERRGEERRGEERRGEERRGERRYRMTLLA
jgi:hypothetical protein